MANIYTVSMEDTTIVADATLICVRTASALTSRASVIQILRASVSQRGSTTSQMLGVRIGQKASAFGTFTSATPAPLVLGGPASGITGSTSVAAASAGVDASAEGAGTVTTYFAEAFNQLNGWVWVPTPEERIIVPTDTAFIVKIVGTPGTLTNWYADLTYMEIN